jgi:hypothetical protein
VDRVDAVDASDVVDPLDGFGYHAEQFDLERRGDS